MHLLRLQRELLVAAWPRVSLVAPPGTISGGWSWPWDSRGWRTWHICNATAALASPLAQLWGLFYHSPSLRSAGSSRKLRLQLSLVSKLLSVCSPATSSCALGSCCRVWPALHASGKRPPRRSHSAAGRGSCSPGGALLPAQGQGGAGKGPKARCAAKALTPSAQRGQLPGWSFLESETPVSCEECRQGLSSHY